MGVDASVIESIDVDDLLLTYLRHYWISYNGPTIEKELAERIREKIVGRQQAVDMATALASDAFDYSALFSPLEHTGWANFDKEARGYVYIMTRVLQIEQIRPLLLAVIRHFSPKEAAEAFRHFLSWSVRFLIAGGGGGGVLDRHYGLRAKEITAGEVKSAAQVAERMKGIVRTEAEFREALLRCRVSKKILARYYLRSIELAMAGDPRPMLGGILDDTKVYNLEHVIPLNPSDAWKLPEEIVQGYSRRLGNMALLDPDTNVDVGNNSFSEKKKVYKESKLIITKEICDFGDWGPKEIDERQAALADIAVKVWAL